MGYLPIRRIDYVSLKSMSRNEIEAQVMPIIEDIKQRLELELGYTIFVCCKLFCIENRTLWYVYDRDVAKKYNLDDNIIKMESVKKKHILDMRYTTYQISSNAKDYDIYVDNLKPNMYIDIVLGDE